MESIAGVPLKYISLVTLVVQNSALVLVMRYSRTLAGPRYLSSTAVVMSELMKFTVCLIVHVWTESKTRKMTVYEVWKDVFGKDSSWIPMSVPAILYFFQNNLQYVAVTLLDAATFQVTYQLKILTTALFSVLILKRSLSTKKWVALGFLTIGVAIVQYPSSSSSTATSKGSEAAGGVAEKFLGLIAVGSACMLSGLAGVWFEKVLKGTKASLFLRNIQLSLFSILPGLIFGVYIANGQSVAENGFFYGYNFWTWATISCQALGGLIVAVVVKYADNILKGFATSLSIILSCIASIFIFDFEVTALFCIGAIVVLYATHLYGQPDRTPPLIPTSHEIINVNYKKLDN